MAEFDDLIPTVEGDNPFADLHPSAVAEPPKVQLSPYEKLRMQGVGPGLSATAGPVGTPEEAAQIFSSLAEPAIPIPRIQAKSTLGQIAAAPYNVAAGLAENIESPLGVATLPIFASPVGRAAFAALGTVQGLKQLATAKTPGEATEGALLAGISPLLARTTLKERPANAPQERYVKENIPVERPGDGQVRPPGETGGGGGLQSETGVGQETQVPLTEDQALLAKSQRGEDLTAGEQERLAKLQAQPTPAPTGEDQPQAVTQPAPSEVTATTPVPAGAEPAKPEPTVTSPVTQPATMTGAAHVSEIPEVSQTGLKNAVGEMERVGLGLHDAPETVTRNMAKAWGEAGQIEADKPGTGANLAAMLARDPDMGITDTESALLLRHKVDLFNKINDAAERTHTGDEASRAKAQAEHDALVVQYGQLLDSVKLRGREWGREGRWRQAMAQEDFTFSSTDDMNRYHRSITGEDLPGDKLDEAGQKAGEVKTAQDEADKATGEVISDLDKKAPRPRTPDAEQAALDAASKAVRENAARIAKLDSDIRVADQARQTALDKIEQVRRERALTSASDAVRRNALRIAEDENKARVAQAVRDRDVARIQLKREQKILEASQKAVREGMLRIAKTAQEVKEQTRLKDQEKAAKAALDAASKAVRENAKRLADLDVATRVAKTVADRKTADIQRKAAQKAVAAADKQHRDAANDLAKAQRALQGDPIKAVWSKVRELIDKGEGDFDTIRNRVAIELGMKFNQVTRLMAQDQRTKRLMDDAWRKQQRAGQLRQEAKRWVAGVNTPEALKLAQGVPRVMFGVKTFGHGTVPLGTHAPFVLFDPRYTGIYLKRYGTMYHMVGSKAFYQQQVRDLQMRPNWVAARRGGLVNDPRAYEDYTNPEIVKRITSGQIGNRGFTVLKILRQDMFDQQWDRLTKSEQTDEMAGLIADSVNHITGVTKAMAPKSLGVALFAPRLEASRVAFAGDLLKAAGILTKQAWTRASVAEKKFALEQVKSKALIAGTLYALLQANQGINKVLGSKQEVNTTDPMRSDFLKFKIAGTDFAYGNALISMARMPLSLYRVVSSDGGKARNLVYADESVYTVLGRYTRSQLSPFMGTLTDLGLGSDYASRPLPRTAFGLLPQTRPVPKRLAAEGVKPYTYPEYFWQQASPIPAQEVVKEVWKNGIGLSDRQLEELGKAIARSTINGATGGRVTEDIPRKPKSFIPP